MTQVTSNEKTPGCWILIPPEADPGTPSSGNARVWGLTAPERLRRALLRAGANSVQLLESSEATPGVAPGPVVVLRGDFFYDERLVQGLLGRASVILQTDDASHEWVAVSAGGAQLPAAVESLRAESAASRSRLNDMSFVVASDLAPAFNQALRKTDPPFLYKAEVGAVRSTENRIFRSAYKGLTDLVTKWVWPIPARELTRLLARKGVRPNSVTALSYVFTFIALALFATGHFAWGLAAGWFMTFLDTVDGKLARCTLTSTKLGNVLDHGLDLVHPPFWWFAFGYGLGFADPVVWFSSWLIVISYVVGRALEGLFMNVYGMEIFLWRPFDGVFRTVIARRNPNLLLLSVGTAAGRPDLGFFAVAVWTLVCNVVHVVRLTMASRAKRRGETVRPWAAVKAGAEPVATPSAT